MVLCRPGNLMAPPGSHGYPAARCGKPAAAMIATSTAITHASDACGSPGSAEGQRRPRDDRMPDPTTGLNRPGPIQATRHFFLRREGVRSIASAGK